MPGVMLLDDTFTKEALEAGLRNGFPIVHVASHFVPDERRRFFISCWEARMKREASDAFGYQDRRKYSLLEYRAADALRMRVGAEWRAQWPRTGWIGRDCAAQGSEGGHCEPVERERPKHRALMRKFSNLDHSCGNAKGRGTEAGANGPVREEVKPEARHV